MKKLLAAAAALCPMIFALAGCAGGDNFTEKEYHSGEQAIERIEVDAEDRELEITASEDGQVHIYYCDGEKEYLEISVSEENVLTVRLVYDKDWTDYIGFKPAAEYRRIELRVPDGAVYSLSAATTNEDINVTGLTFLQSVSLDCNGGDVAFENLGAGESIALKAKNGNITGSVSGSIDDFAIECTIKKGESNLPTDKKEGGKLLSADCNNGDIEINFAG